MRIKYLLICIGIMMATAMPVSAEVYECLHTSKHYTGSSDYDKYATPGPIHKYHFDVDVDDAWSLVPVMDTGAYIKNTNSVIGSKNVVVRWWVSPGSDLKYTLTVYCKS
jgi:hypothetical protein